MAYGLVFLPVSITTIIINTTPFWVAILSFLILKDKLKRFEVFCMIGCFIGIITITVWRENPTASLD